MCLFAEVHEEVACLLGGPLPSGMGSDPEDADTPAGVLYHSQDVGLGAVEQAGREEVARQDRVGLGAQELRPGRPGPPPGGVDAAGLEDLPYGRRCDLTPSPASSPWILRYPHSGFSRASRRTRALMFRRVAGRPVLPRMDLAAQRQQTMSRCQRRIVSGVITSRSPWRRAFGITLSRAASRARSAQFRFGRPGRRCSMASWWRRIKISAVFHVSSHRDSRSHAATRVIRRKTNRRHMIGDHHGRAAESNSAGQSNGRDSRHAHKHRPIHLLDHMRPTQQAGPRSFCARAAAPSARLGASTPLAQRRGWHHLPRKRAHRGNHNQPAIRGADGERGAIILLENAQDVGDLFAVTWTGPSPADHDPLAHIGGCQPDLEPVAHGGHLFPGPAASDAGKG
jgi:hypothetical protein